MVNHFFWILLTMFFLNGGSTRLSSQEETLDHEDLQLIEYLFSEYKNDHPGASVIVIKDGNIVLSNSYGISDIRDKHKITPATNFRIASVSKQFTAMALMILVHQGKLDYTTTLTDVFPDFPEYGNAITIRHLITHQSGVIDYYEFLDTGRTAQMLDAEVLDSLKTTEASYFKPGARYRYSNSAYALLAQIVEKVSGNTFAQFMDTEIFRKLDMTNTQVFELKEAINNRAYGHSYENNIVIFNDQSVTSAIQGDGGIYTSVTDYYKWDQALYTDQLIPYQQMADAFSDWDDNEKTGKEGYGYGWFINYQNGLKVLTHSGGTVGFESRVTRVPSLGLSAIIFSNHDGHDRNLWHSINALTSIYSDYKIPMPIEIKMKKEIEQRGTNYAIKLYDQLKNNTKYKYEKTTLAYLASEYYRTENIDVAKELYNKAIKENPNYFGGYYGLARIYKEQGELDQAILNYKKVVALGVMEDQWVIDRANNELIELINKKSVLDKK